MSSQLYFVNLKEVSIYNVHHSAKIYMEFYYADNQNFVLERLFLKENDLNLRYNKIINFCGFAHISVANLFLIMQAMPFDHKIYYYSVF